VAVANTTIGYLKAYAHGQMAHYPPPHGATEAPESAAAESEAAAEQPGRPDEDSAG
jgi:hypothetical protein